MAEETAQLPPPVKAGHRIDWERLIIQVQRSAWLQGSSQNIALVEIGKACGRGYTWAWNLKNIPGTEPKFHDGLLLVGLWREKTGLVDLPLYQEFNR